LSSKTHETLPIKNKPKRPQKGEYKEQGQSEPAPVSAPVAVLSREWAE